MPRSSFALIVVTLLAVLIVGVGGYLAFRDRFSDTPRGVRDIETPGMTRVDPRDVILIPEPTPDPAPTPTPVSDPPPDPTPDPPPADPEPIELAMLQPPGSMRGVAITSEGMTVPGVEIRLEFANLVEGGKTGPDLKATTNSAGLFDITGVPPGEWVVFADHPGYATGTTPGVMVVSDEITHGVEVQMLPAVTLRGSVVTTAGVGLENATVTVSRVSLAVSPVTGEVTRREVVYRRGQSNARGEFTFERCAPGSTVVIAKLQGFAPERRDIDLVVGGENRVRIEMFPAASIGGRVRTSQGRLLAEAKIELSDPQDSKFKAQTNTRGDGTFLISGLRSGRVYRLTASAANFAPSGPHEILAGRLENLIIMEAGGSISGIVRSLGTGEAASAIGIRIESTGSGYPVNAYTVSAADGTYSFRDLPSGRYNLRVESDRLTADPRLGVQVRIPNETRNIDFTVYPGRTISGTVSEAVTGERVGGAAVNIQSRVGPEYLTARQSTAVTDASGTFEATNLPHGLYVLEATAEGYLRYPGPEATAEVRVLPNESTPPVELLLARGGTVRGTVRDAYGNLQEGAIVQLYNTPGARTRIDTGRLNAATDRAGRFEITGIPLSQEVNVTASAAVIGAPARVDSGSARVDERSAYGKAKGKSSPIVLTEFLSTAEVDIALGIGAPVTVSVRDEDGGLITDANVSISHSGFPGDPNPANWRGQTGSLGTHTFLSIPQGSGSVSASKSDYIGASRGYTLRDGEPVELELTLMRAVTLEGFVEDDLGHPVIDGVVQARAESGARGGGQSGLDHRGYFKINGVGPGNFTLNVLARRQTPNGVVEVRREVGGIESDASQPRIVVPMSGQLEGIVLDANSSDPIPGVRVQIDGRYAFRDNRLQGFRSVATASTVPGAFSFPTLPPAVYSLTITAPNYLPLKVDNIDVRSPGTFWTGQLMLSQGASVRARVVSDSTGEAIGGARLQLTPTGLATNTNAQGVGRIASVPPEMYSLTASHGRYLPKTLDLILVPPEEETDVGVIRLEEGGRVFGRIYDSRRSPVVGANVTLRYHDEDSRRTARSDGGGIVRFEGLKAGAVVITASASFPRGNLSRSIEHQVSSPGESQFEIILAGGLQLTGVVISPRGESVTGLSVRAYPLELNDTPIMGGMVNGMVSPNGQFTFDNLNEGRFLLLGTATVGGQPTFWHTTVLVTPPSVSISFIVPRYRLNGRVTDASTGETLTGMNVRLRGLSFPQSGVAALRPYWEWNTKTDDFGFYQVSNLSPGTYEIVASEPGSTNTSLGFVTIGGTGTVTTYDIEWEP